MAVHPSALKKIPLLSLQAWQLKQLAFLVGLGPGANKAETVKLLASHLREGQKGSITKEAKSEERRKNRDTSPKRTLSIDMGVKNLAFCVLERKSKQNAPFHLTEWHRRDVTKMLPPNINPATLWTPSTLSQIAYRLVQNFVHKPNLDAILIERQRFRSGGAAAIQEWTVRVNMLEAMLWSSLETLRSSSFKTSDADQADTDARRTNGPSLVVPPAYEISPARVGAYWSSKNTQARMAMGMNSPLNVHDLIQGVSKTEWEGGGGGGQQDHEASESDSDSSGGASLSKTKRGFEKKEKIALVRSWFENGDLSFEAGLGDMVDAFLGKKKGAGRAKKKTTTTTTTTTTTASEEVAIEEEEFAPERTNKMDDLADCIVQGVTFALWQRNRRDILEYDRLTWDEDE